MYQKALQALNNLMQSKLAGDGAKYLFWNLMAAGIPFLSLPILTRVLPQSEYGNFAIFFGALTFMNALVGIGLVDKIRRDFKDKDSTGNCKNISTSIVLSVIASVVWLIILWLWADLAKVITGIPVAYLPMLVLLSFGNAIVMILLAVAEYTHKTNWYGLWRVGVSFSFYAATIAFILLWGWGWQGFIAGFSVAMLVVGGAGLVWLYKQGLFKLSFNMSVVKPLLAFGLPLIPYKISFAALSLTDRIMINRYTGLETTGTYMVSYQIAAVMFLISTAIYQAWMPWFMGQLVEKNATTAQTIRKALYTAIGVTVAIAILTAVVSPVLIWLLVGPEYQVSVLVTICLILSYSAFGIFLLVGSFLHYAHKTPLLATTMVATALINLVLNYLLVPAYGAEGAAYATMISFALAIIIVTLFARPYIAKICKNNKMESTANV